MARPKGAGRFKVSKVVVGRRLEGDEQCWLSQREKLQRKKGYEDFRGLGRKQDQTGCLRRNARVLSDGRG